VKSRHFTKRKTSRRRFSAADLCYTHAVCFCHKQRRLQQCIRKLVVVEQVLKHATNVCLCCNGSVAMSRTRFYYCRCYTTDDRRVWSFGNTCLDSTGSRDSLVLRPHQGYGPSRHMRATATWVVGRRLVLATGDDRLPSMPGLIRYSNVYQEGSRDSPYAFRNVLNSSIL